MGRSAFGQLNIYASGRVTIIYLYVVQTKSSQFQFVKNFFACIVCSDSGYKANVKTEIFEMVGEVKWRSAQTPVIWKYVKQYLTNY